MRFPKAVVMPVVTMGGLSACWLPPAIGSAAAFSPVEPAPLTGACPTISLAYHGMQDAPGAKSTEPKASSGTALASELTPDAAVERLRAAKDAEIAGVDLDAIESVIKQRLAAEPKNARWHYGLGLVERARRNASEDQAARWTHADAYFKHITKATTLDPKEAEYFAELGVATMGTMRPSDGFLTKASVSGDARSAWKKAVELDPNHIGALYSLAMYEIQARQRGGFLFGSYDTAKESGDRLVTLPEGKHLGHRVLGALAAAQEEWDEMARQYVLAEGTASTDAQRAAVLFGHAGHLIEGKKDAKAALLVIERLAALQPDIQMYFYRATAKKLGGDCAGAIEDLRQVLERDPDQRGTRLMLAECYEATGDAASAIAVYEEFKAKFPEDDGAAQADKAIKRLKARTKR